MSMTEPHRKVLEKVAPDFLKDLKYDDIVPYLLGDQAITSDDCERIDTKGARRDKVAALLDILPRRGDGAYFSLQSSLTKTEGSMHLYEIMKKNEKWVYARLQEELEKEKQPIQESIDSICVRDVDMPNAENLQEDVKQPKNPDKVLKDPDLLILSQNLGEHWEMLALILGMSKAVIYQCKENNRFNTQSQIFDMLYKWKCSQGKKATVSVMLEACKKINLLGEDAYEFLYTVNK
eukprot:XP_003725850.1 PREDICTED: death domain-containing protein CRADD-like [Strongylocentrotus purpuratus]